ncbi:glycosyltransferase family 2 protein [Flavobacterium sp. MAHUQ-51]|uniref:glycosyltransferase family 2 protein n=1 Tax=Flavobacterium sp. GCM10022190 TaxID=3252639 RepID=UPI00361E404A
MIAEKSIKLAIVIPFYKLTFFETTLESLANQTDKRFRVYIGDDASPENCSGLLENYNGKLDFIYYRFETNLGGQSLTKQWERCIELSNNEEWFMILGDDDYLGEDVVAKFYNAIATFGDKSNVIRNASVLINEKNEVISKTYYHPINEEAIDSYCRKLKGDSRSSLSEHIFRMDSYKKYKFKDYKMAWSSDDRAIIDFADGKSVFSIDSIVYVRMSDLNISGGKDNIQEKISGRLEGTKDLIFDYQSKMSKAQIKLFIGLYENLIYRYKDFKWNHISYLIYLSIRYFGFNYTNKQIKSLFFKLIRKNNFVESSL